jgi:tetratricopeptide (TPR) repeat protein
MYKKVIYIIPMLFLFCSYGVKANQHSYDDYEKYRRQADSLFKTSNYLAAIKKYKSCLIFKEKDVYSLNQIKIIDDIFNKSSIAQNLSTAGKIPEAIEMYRKILALNADDIEANKNIVSLLETEADKFINEGDDEAAIKNLTEAALHSETIKKGSINTKIKQLNDKKNNPDYIKIIEEGNKLLKAAKYTDATKKFETVFALKGYQKDKQASIAVQLIKDIQLSKETSTKNIKEGNFSVAIKDLSKILEAEINDQSAKTELVTAYEKEADQLLNSGKKDESILLISKAIEAFSGDSKKQNVLQKKLKALTTATAKKTTKD